ncbi:lycopene cyclase domain-containing protein [Microbacterium endophyticum]|uniref:Lycopene cyclase domain-containing protein n=1 Tax=Microbacterium endophyticum TaxID=1526412 RepID=A0A7W4YLS0_9MICO|nr:lycopene cyclase domain-containing protein [Microbacterium endophyticum]MBB2974754.1 lycopene cyclase domain-containing protein [Microbacterium endophyticum]NIK37051.1 lycopene cyclase domain-containing protein [Microbacterium endophyticum]
MPGIYLGALLVSFAGVAVLDARFRLVFASAPIRTVATTLIAVGFFLLWDAAGILNEIFLKGDSQLFIGIDLAPDLPLEEPIFLAFLCYLSLVIWSAIMRALNRRSEAKEQS